MILLVHPKSFKGSEFKERRQIANLRRTRDLLLPRLISGEVEVSGVEGYNE